MNPPCEVEKAEAMGHLGNKEIKLKYNIDPKKIQQIFLFIVKMVEKN